MRNSLPKRLPSSSTFMRQQEQMINSSAPAPVSAVVQIKNLKQQQQPLSRPVEVEDDKVQAILDKVLVFNNVSILDLGALEHSGGPVQTLVCYDRNGQKIAYQVWGKNAQVFRVWIE